MPVKKSGLGKGLDSLIPNKNVKSAKPSVKADEKKAAPKEEILEAGPIMVKINKVEPNREQPRKDFDEDALMELADSIRQFGILQPLLVQKKKNYYGNHTKIICPSCGAEVKLSSQKAVCSYCGGVLQSDFYDWQTEKFDIYEKMGMNLRRTLQLLASVFILFVCVFLFRIPRYPWRQVWWQRYLLWWELRLLLFGGK